MKEIKIKISPELHSLLKDTAKADEMSMQQYVINTLEDDFRAKKVSLDMINKKLNSVIKRLDTEIKPKLESVLSKQFSKYRY